MGVGMNGPSFWSPKNEAVAQVAERHLKDRIHAVIRVSDLDDGRELRGRNAGRSRGLRREEPS